MITLSKKRFAQKKDSESKRILSLFGIFFQYVYAIYFISS